VARILVVDDEARMQQLLAQRLGRQGHQVRTAGDGIAALAALEEEDFDVVLSDLRMPQLDGMGLLSRIRERWPETRVILVTGHGDQVRDAVAAMQAGAYSYLLKPLDLDETATQVERAAAEKALARENRRLRHVVRREQEQAGRLVGESAAMARVRELIAKVAPTDATVLVRGESGTGKELTARALHEHSRRAQRPFLAVNCAALPDTLLESELFGYLKGAFTGADQDKAGLFELADGGTLFLDEVAEAGSAVQAKLLRALEEKRFLPVGGRREIQVDVRIVAATNKDLERLIRAGAFREDLFYRFNVFPVVLPPLRERLEDLPSLLARFLGDLGRDPAELDPRIEPRLRAYPWPGNVRELRNIVERAHILAGDGPILPEHVLLPETGAAGAEDLAGAEPLNLKVEDHERRLIRLALKRAGGNKTRAAELLGMTRRTLYSRLERLDLPVDGD
jgi:DNA-binding NtrC family response regulator